MNYVTEGLEPAKVFHYFEKISAIPHGSYHTEAISEYIVSFAKKHGLDYKQDKLGNVIIYKAASKGKEASAPVILQGHMDMVLEKKTGNPIDMEKEAITLKIDGDDLTADGTTLGGDDGIAVAYMMAILSDDTLEHPPLECVFTVDEETGMEGAVGLDTSELQGKRMINLDSELEGILTAGCAGGVEETFTIPVVKNEKTGMILHLEITGLKGGHSGECIGMGRANADILMGRLLDRIAKKNVFRLISISGGNKDNAIPRESQCDILFAAQEDDKTIIKSIEKFTKQIDNEYSAADPDITVSYEWTDSTAMPVAAMTKKDTTKIVQFLMLIPNGLIESDCRFEDMPQTSLNLGILNTTEDSVKAVTLIRSSINSQKKYIVRKLLSLADVFNAKLEDKSEYPAWEYKNDSKFRSELVAVYEEQYGKKPVVSITHGGLECGLLSDRIKGFDCVSIGPNMEGIHTPDEKLSISSTKRVYEYLVNVLAKIS